MKNLLNRASREGGVTQILAGAEEAERRLGTTVVKHSRRMRFWSSNRAGEGGTTRSRGRAGDAVASRRRGASGDREVPGTRGAGDRGGAGGVGGVTISQSNSQITR